MGCARPQLYKNKFFMYSVGEAPVRTLYEKKFYIYSVWEARAQNYIRWNSANIV